ncbi:MAG TPA: hypothetical protein VI818_05690 [Candidatus Thermoplasmatota archaeon]|nr:hypothetical protein [Candidatus Thermoplasmatota archaeon]
MRERLGTATGRGLLAARTGESIILAAALLFLATGLYPRVLVFGAVIAGVPGLLSARRIWVGRFEFGPEHETGARRGIYLFAAASILLVLSLLSFQTFPSPSLGIDFTNETIPEDGSVHRFKDLLPPLFMLGAAMAAEVASGAFIVWNLVGKRWQRAVAGYGGAGVAACLLVVLTGSQLVRRFEDETGAFADSTPAAMFYYGRFLDQVLFIAALWIVATRAAAMVFLQRAIAKVMEAEKDGAPSPVSEPASSP